MKSKFAAILTLTVVSAFTTPPSVAQKADAFVRLPFPSFEPQPNATTLYCREILSTSLTAQSAGIGARIDKGAPTAEMPEGYAVRLMFAEKQLLVAEPATDAPAGQRHAYGPDLSYTVVNDDPINFVALNDQDKQVGSLFVVSLDRKTGTMVLTTTYASLPDRGHPYSSASFYACAPSLP